jgi:anti-sigma B factor antagonist
LAPVLPFDRAKGEIIMSMYVQNAGESRPLLRPVAPIEVSTTDVGRTRIVAVAGELDISTAGVLRQAVVEALRPDPENLVIDLTDVSFLGSAGLAALIAAERGSGTTRMRVVAANHATRRALTITGLDKEFELHPSLTTALQAA